MATENPPRGLRLWLFRLAALLLVPAAVLAAAEFVLRLAGFGYPTRFMVPVPGRDGVVATNQKFGWRFFPPKIARAPVPFDLTADKAGGAYRVFVVGGSAARGTPEPAFGIARVLGTMLEAVYPETRFEVANAAMTAVNSHVVLPIVEDLADYDPDLFVVYLGNNELVGPYGAASVFGPFSPRLATIRASIAVKSTRLGQLLDRAVARPADRQDEWRGMEMFLEQQIAASDPRLEKVYEHLGTNLTDVVRAARGAGAEVLLSTVAVNLADQAPFASLEKEGLSEGERERFGKLLAEARDLLRQGANEAVLERTREAAEIDSGYAELYFLAGRALLALGRTGEAREAFASARDLDGQRFRADSRINDVIRGVAAAEGAALADADAYFREQAGADLPGPGERGVALPGGLLFYEHVHLNFEGNYVLARLIFDEIRERLPERIARQAAAAAEPPGLQEMARELPFTPFDAYEMERQIVGIVSRPPFTHHFWHADELSYRRRRLLELRLAFDADAWRNARQLYERRLEEHEDDLEARRRFAELLARRGEAEQAIEHWRRLVERLPGVAGWHEAYARALAGAGRVDQAVAELRGILEHFPEWRGRILNNLGAVYERAGRRDEAEDAYRRAIEAAPEDPQGLYNLATSTAQRGDLEAAVGLFRDLVERHPDFVEGHHNLGVALEMLGDAEGAAASYRKEIEADPDQPAGHDSLALVLESQGKKQEALAGYARALELDPGYAPAHFNLADLLLSAGRPADAAAYYDIGLRLEPGNVQARYNWTIALTQLGQRERAAAELARVATAYEGAGRSEEARAALEKGLELARAAGAERLARDLERRLEGPAEGTGN